MCVYNLWAPPLCVCMCACVFVCVKPLNGTLSAYNKFITNSLRNTTGLNGHTLTQTHIHCNRKKDVRKTEQKKVHVKSMLLLTSITFSFVFACAFAFVVSCYLDFLFFFLSFQCPVLRHNWQRVSFSLIFRFSFSLCKYLMQ